MPRKLNAEQIKLYQAELLRAYETFKKTHTFRPGQLVRWKESMQNKTLPAFGEPAIVVQVLHTPEIDEDAPASSPYFREPLDLVLAVIDEEGDFMPFHFDSRRFEPFPE